MCCNTKKYEHPSEHHCVQLVPLFNTLTKKEIEEVEQLVHHRVFGKGETVISPEQSPQLTIVAHGGLKMYQLATNGKEQLLRVVEPGGYEGENALFGAVNENLFGETLEETTVCFLKRQDFKKLLIQNPALSLRLLEINAKKSETIEQQASFLMMEAIESRLANYLLQLAKVAHSERVELPMKMKDLANFVGTTPETVSRKFKLLENHGYIRRHGKHIEILDVEKLEDDYV
ncbi:Crp/Fnr family transcriptional regulator [Lactococcus allomyrinae]|uniref:Crp/Fnr family transcriptional regulator n=1 Tax=Lactococcus allomyrinae TaxID=2419773 RepID=A0A387B7V3_9LACT|nr:Crp/Fnr family transcriptional regulator [Lactococcus allomyrinae]AYF99762.1 Crp/Fnr family transcriptional regulator [Lactococcus allomyrinae]